MTVTNAQEPASEGGWLERVLATAVSVRREAIVLAVLIALAVGSRFYDVGTRVMSHDETTHVYYSWNLFRGSGFQHNPLMHGPMQFHLWALSYFLFGDNDTAARIPTSVMGVAAVALTWVFRRWLGRTGSLVAGALMLISPYMLFYSRYTREDPFVIPEALLMFWAVFSYFETRKSRWLYLLAVSLVLHFATKETAFIYAAQLLLFLAAYLVGDLLREPWPRPVMRVWFLVGLGETLLGAGLAGVIFLRDRAEFAALMPTPTTTVGEAAAAAAAPIPGLSPLIGVGALMAILGLVTMLIALVRTFGRRLRTDFPALDLLIITGTLTLPQLAALFAHILGWNPIEYTDPAIVNKDALVVVVLFAVSILVGLAWDWRRWLIAAGSFWGIFVVLYTTVFTNGFGFMTGLVGSLGYWLEQQPVQRGGQPWFYYAFVQIPVYEYLPAIGVLAAIIVGLVAWIRSLRRRDQNGSRADASAVPTVTGSGFPVTFFLGYWVFTALLAYSYAGEKMPWLTVHIALPMILLAGWAFGRFFDSIDWSRLKDGRAWLDLSVLLLLIVALFSTLGYLFGLNPPFRGTTLEQLQSTTGFLVALITAACAVGYLALHWKGWPASDRLRLAGVLGLAVLAVLTARASFRASFVNFDLANEYLVYAHSAPGVRMIMDQIDDLATRTADGKGLDVGYDDETSYPYMWYLRNYPRVHFFGGTPSRDLLNYPVVIVGAGNWSKVEPILGKRYHAFEFPRLWWPNQDYWRIGWSSIESERNAEQQASGAGELPPMSAWEYSGRVWRHLQPFFTDPAVRHAVWEVWLNRDFTEWAALNNADLSIENWSPADRMKMYVRKDIAALLWDYGVTPASLEPGSLEDPYAKGMTKIQAQVVVGSSGYGTGAVQWAAQRGGGARRERIRRRHVQPSDPAPAAGRHGASGLGRVRRSGADGSPRRDVQRTVGHCRRSRRHGVRRRYLEPSRPAILVYGGVPDHVRHVWTGGDADRFLGAALGGRGQPGAGLRRRHGQQAHRYLRLARPAARAVRRRGPRTGAVGRARRAGDRQPRPGLCGRHVEPACAGVRRNHAQHLHGCARVADGRLVRPVARQQAVSGDQPRGSCVRLRSGRVPRAVFQQRRGLRTGVGRVRRRARPVRPGRRIGVRLGWIGVGGRCRKHAADAIPAESGRAVICGGGAWMKLHEYQSKQLFAQHGIPIPRGRVAMTAAEAKSIAEELRGRVVVKAQVLVGGRGKAGGIRLANSPEEALEIATQILAMQIKGLPVRKVLVDEAANIQAEIYLGVTNDRAARRPVMIASAEGGIEIEEVARTAPSKIARMHIDPLLGLREYQARDLAASIELPRDHWRAFIDIARGLYEAYRDCDATLAEINPLVVTQAQTLLALDGKMVVDDNALFRRPKLAEMRDLDEEAPAEGEARKYGLSYVKLDGDIGCMVNGAGLAMATMDVIKLAGGAPANFLDIGGGAGADKVAAALEIILSDKAVKAVLLNVFGGITRCDEVARGILMALQDVPTQIPMVTRLVGTNEAEGRQLLAEKQMVTATSLFEAAEKAVALTRQGVAA